MQLSQDDTFSYGSPSSLFQGCMTILKIQTDFQINMGAIYDYSIYQCHLCDQTGKSSQTLEGLANSKEEPWTTVLEQFLNNQMQKYISEYKFQLDFSPTSKVSKTISSLHHSHIKLNTAQTSCTLYMLP